MSRRAARTVMAVSAVVLVAAIGLWVAQASGDERADLVGTAVTTTSTSTTTSTTAPPTTSTTLPLPEVPVTLVVPSLGVDASVIPVGLEPNGEMEVPPAAQAGWYHYGPRPGEVDGTAVIAAHVDFNGERGVFYDLRSIEVGSEVSVADQAGAVHRYVVTERYQVAKDELPIEQIFVADGPPGLTLITCGGAFDGSERSYEDNIVVRAVPA
ncbi:MAG: class F sortase [Acidimicrobiales bacterium]